MRAQLARKGRENVRQCLLSELVVVHCALKQFYIVQRLNTLNTDSKAACDLTVAGCRIYHSTHQSLSNRPVDSRMGLYGIEGEHLRLHSLRNFRDEFIATQSVLQQPEHDTDDTLNLLRPVSFCCEDPTKLILRVVRWLGGGAVGMSCAVSSCLVDASLVVCLIMLSEWRGREAAPCNILDAFVVLYGDFRGSVDRHGVVGRSEFWSGER